MAKRPGAISLALSLLAVLVPFFALVPQASCRTAGKNTKEPADKNLKLGKQLYKSGDYDGAQDALLQATYFARNGYAPEAFYWLGMTYKAKHMDQKAVDAFKQHIAQALDKAAPGHLALATVYTRLKNYNEAEVEISRAFSDTQYFDPLTRQIYLAQGINLEAKGHPREAIASYIECLGRDQRDWDNYEAWIRMCECHMKIKEWVDAYKFLTLMTKTGQPLVGIHYERVYLDLGICMLAKGNHQGAIEYWHKALEYDPDNKEAHLQLAMLLDAETHLSASLKEYKQFVRCCSDEDQDRKRQVEQRMQIIEQKLGSVEDTPVPVQPSPYMRAQSEREAKENKEREIKVPVGDPGF